MQFKHFLIWLALLTCVGCAVDISVDQGEEEIQQTVSSTQTPAKPPTPLATEFPLTWEELINLSTCNPACILGISPRITDAETGYQILAALGPVEITADEDQTEGKSFVNVAFFGGGSETFDTVFVGLVNQGGIVEAVDITGSLPEEFDLPALLATYGEPDEIYLNTYNNVTAPRFFIAYLFYKDTGMMVQYNTEGEKAVSSISGCFLRASAVKLISPEIADSFVTAFDYISRFPAEWESIKELSSVTDINNEDFVEEASLNQQVCIQTTASFWPDE